MSNETTTTVATPKAKKSPKGKPSKVEANGKKGLRKPMVRILKALSKANKALTRSEIAAKAPVDVASCVEYLGSHDPKVRAANDKKHFPSLITMGLVRVEVDEEAGNTYLITAKGKAEAAKA